MLCSGVLPFMSRCRATIVFSLLISATLVSSAPATQSKCYCFPGDLCWPSAQGWQAFNQSIGGKLVPTIPLASICHNDNFAKYDAAACQKLQDIWNTTEIHYESSSSIMAPYFQNRSCEAFTPRAAQCVIGTYIQYAVNVSTTQDIQQSLAFAQSKNIRLVIRNTGHDYNGKSTGAGALGIWTHHLKNIDFLDYTSPKYTGKAFRFGAGIQGFEAQAAAHAKGYVVTTGICTTVGVAGGYTQGGGHGPLATRLGLGADQVLEWQVVLSSGQLVTATPQLNSDLYWALSGGGGGTYGVVVSMTVRAYPDYKVTSGATLFFTNAGISQSTYYGAIQSFVQTLPAITDAGAVASWLQTNTTFVLAPLLAPGVSSAQIQKLLSPALQTLNQSHVTYQFSINDYPTYLDAFNAVSPPMDVTEYSLGGWLLPRSLASSNSKSLISTFQSLNDQGVAISGIALNVTQGQKIPNALNPAWRSTLLAVAIGTPWDYYDYPASLAGKQAITQKFMPQLESLAPNSGAYLNEGDSSQPDFQKAFYGDNYSRLLAIKDKYDPSGIFYGLTAVGSERWFETADKRLCRKG